MKDEETSLETDFEDRFQVFRLTWWLHNLYFVYKISIHKFYSVSPKAVGAWRGHLPPPPPFPSEWGLFFFLFFLDQLACFMFCCCCCCFQQVCSSSMSVCVLLPTSTTTENLASCLSPPPPHPLKSWYHYCSVHIYLTSLHHSNLHYQPGDGHFNVCSRLVDPKGHVARRVHQVTADQGMRVRGVRGHWPEGHDLC